MSIPYIWKLWYEDGTTFSNTDGLQEQSPEWGVVCISQKNDGKDIVWQDSVYIYRTDRGYWSGHDWVGFVDQMVHYSHHVACVRVGRDILTPIMRDIANTAMREVRGDNGIR